MEPTAIEELLERIDRATTELHLANKAALELARSMAREAAARLGDDVEWTRMPSAGERCRVSGWSRSKLNHQIAAGTVRKKRAAGCAFYSAADVRQVIAA